MRTVPGDILDLDHQPDHRGLRTSGIAGYMFDVPALAITSLDYVVFGVTP
jgi:hypothetical protein